MGDIWNKYSKLTFKYNPGNNTNNMEPNMPRIKTNKAGMITDCILPFSTPHL